ncbi:cytochrome P450 family protein [Haliangium ochraceum]|uniref:Cytochrome P450 n=1 Tax=Haliangium ochraceum (strain DSM 14365 / JCM 11303 / SMP-2) TaxID=502025 RepID=D0LZN6_HALO1|nr:cytochrome P450 [Haliangium ochraceum]ACY18015.1 cytochrome P450 [Haliangium ochraceum DSM 14365]
MIDIPDITRPRHKANPYPLYARLRAEAPAVRVIFGDKRPAWLITRHADVSAALKDPRLSKNPFVTLSAEEQRKQLPWIPAFARPLSKNMLDQDPPDHGRLRRLVHKVFTPRMVAELRTRIEAITGDLLGAARARGRFDLLEDFAMPLPITVICEMLGVPEHERRRFRILSNRMVSIVTPSEMLRGLPAVWLLVRYLRGLIARRRREGGEDMLAVLVRAEEDGDRLDEDELLAMTLLLLVAGHETTMNLIASGTLALLDAPEEFARLAGEPTLMASAVEELLRFTSPVDVATERYASTELQVGGQVIPRGERVFAVLGSANRDGSVFDHPDALMLDRSPNRHVAFGHGPHYCLGGPLARLEGEIAFAAICNELRGLALDVPRDSLRWKRSPVLRGLRSLPVRCDGAPAYSLPRAA